MLNECRSPINTKSDCSRQKGDFETRIGLIYSFGSDEALDNIWELDEFRSVFNYDEIFRHWILQLKFYVKEHLSPLLGRLLALSFQNSY